MLRCSGDRPSVPGIAPVTRCCFDGFNNDATDFPPRVRSCTARLWQSDVVLAFRGFVEEKGGFVQLFDRPGSLRDREPRVTAPEMDVAPAFRTTVFFCPVRKSSVPRADVDRVGETKCLTGVSVFWIVPRSLRVTWGSCVTPCSAGLKLEHAMVGSILGLKYRGS